MKIEQATIPCQGYDIYADWYDGSKDDVLFVLIGLGSSKERAVKRVTYLCQKTGMSALILDYSGHGLSPFNIEDISPAQNFLEVIEAYDFIANKLPRAKITVFGTSYGGFMGTQLTKYRDFDRLILRVPAIYPPDIFYTKRKNINSTAIRTNYRVDPENFKQHPLLKRAERFKGPVLVVSHELDDICPKPVTDAYIRAFNADTFEQLGFMHAESQTNPSSEIITEYLDKIASWINTGDLE